MKTFTAMICLVLFPIAGFGLEPVSPNKVQLSNTKEIYGTSTAVVYDEATGLRFPFKAVLTLEIGGCSAAKFDMAKLRGTVPGTMTYFFKLNAFSPAIVCTKPDVTYSQSFDFPKETDFADFVTPAGVHIDIYRLAE